MGGSVLGGMAVLVLAAAGCGTASGHRSARASVGSWYQKGYQFARHSLAKGDPPDTAANVAGGTKGDLLAWCDEAYSPSSDPGAPRQRGIRGVVTNAPAAGLTAAGVKAYSQWITGCGAGLNVSPEQLRHTDNGIYGS